jgi:hypothetical protein
VTRLIGLLLNAPRTIRATSSAASREGRKTEEGTMMLPSGQEPESNAVAVVDPPEAQIQTSAATEQSSDVLTNCKRRCLGVAENLRGVVGWTAYRSLFLIRRGLRFISVGKFLLLRLPAVFPGCGRTDGFNNRGGRNVCAHCLEECTVWGPAVHNSF